MTSGFKFQIISSLMQSWGVHLTWFDCNFINEPPYGLTEENITAVTKHNFVDK